MSNSMWRESKERTVTGRFRKGKKEHSYYIELDDTMLRWNVYPAQEHLALLGERVCAIGMRVEYKALSLSTMTLAE